MLFLNFPLSHVSKLLTKYKLFYSNLSLKKIEIWFAKPFVVIFTYLLSFKPECYEPINDEPGDVKPVVIEPKEVKHTVIEPIDVKPVDYEP